MAAKKKAESGKRKAGKGKGGNKVTVAAAIAVANHPRAKHQIALMKSWAGLLACCIAGYSAWKGGAVFVDVALRAVLWGIAAYVAVWAMAVQVWRQIAIAEVRAAERAWKEQKQAKDQQVEKLRKALDDADMPADGTGAMPVS